LSTVQGGPWTTTEVSAMTSSQIGWLNSTELQAFSTAQANALTAKQIGNLTSTELQGFSTAQANALTAKQIGSLTTTAGSIATIRPRPD
jgi:hypothetical protein